VAVGDPLYGQCDVSSWTLETRPLLGRTSGSPSPASPSPSASTPSGGPSPATTVYLLDGSGAREAIVSNTDWAAEIEGLGGPTVQARDLGVRNQTFLQDAMLVDALPKGKALALIGLSVGRFTGDPAEGVEGYDPNAVLASTAKIRHLYTASHVLSDRRKRALLEHWLREDAPVFEQTRAANAAALERLIEECRARGLRPVLLELPLDLEIIGSSLDRQRAAYRADARRLAARYDIPYLDFIDELRLPSGNFFDLVHLVEPGRRAYQKRLSADVVALLRTYRLGGR